MKLRPNICRNFSLIIYSILFNFAAVTEDTRCYEFRYGEISGTETSV